MKSITLLFILVGVSFFTAGCGDLDSEDSPEEITQKFGARISGRWMAPQSLIQTAGRYNITYVGAGPWRGTSGCGGSFSQGAKFVKTWVQDAYPHVTTVGGYACRQIRGGSAMSVHSTGRAIDIHFPLDGGQADNDKGDAVANYLLEHAEEMGVQLIIWDRTIWSSSRSGTARFREYTGQHPHHDHIHMELTPDAAQKRTPWFSDPATPGSARSTCANVTPATGGTVDNTSRCFILHGETRFWRTENKGFSGSLRWTNAYQSTRPSNWAQWNLNLAQAGKYRVSYYSEPEYAVFDSTRYEVTHGSSTSEVFVDQSAGGVAGWKELGVFDFKAGAGQSVAVFDNTMLGVGANQHIIADAIRIEPVQISANPVPTGGCGMVFRGGGTIDNKSDCFEAFGETRFWRKQSGGYGGTFLWTNAFSSSQPSNWAKWNVNLEEGGLYDVYYYSVPNYAKFRSTRYEIKHSGRTTDTIVNLFTSRTEGWKKIGTYEFKAGQEQSVSVFDNSSGSVPRNQSIIVDSIRLLPIGTSQSVVSGDADIDDDVFEEEQIDDHVHTETNEGYEPHVKDFQDEIEIDNGPDDILIETGCATTRSDAPPLLFFVGLFGMFFMFRRRR